MRPRAKVDHCGFLPSHSYHDCRIFVSRTTIASDSLPQVTIHDDDDGTQVPQIHYWHKGTIPKSRRTSNYRRITARLALSWHGAYTWALIRIIAALLEPLPAVGRVGPIKIYSRSCLSMAPLPVIHRRPTRWWSSLACGGT